MAQFLKAKFLSDALKWKADPRHASDQFFAGLRYDPYIFAQARLTFPEYDKRFPAPANQAFVENFAKDLANPTKNQPLLKIINPDILTPEMETANSQFEASAQLEQQIVAQTSNQPIAQPFSLIAPSIPTIVRSTPPATPVTPEAEQSTETTPPLPTQTPPTQSIPAQVAPTQAPPTTPPQPQPTVSTPPIQAPRIPISLTNTVRNFGSRIGSRIGIFFQRNVGNYFTAGRIATVVSGGIGAITGGALTNGSALGILGGGGLGAVAPSWIRSGEGTKFLGKAGNSAINAGVNLSNQVAGGIPKFPKSPGKKKLIWIFMGVFFLTAMSLAFTNPQPGPVPLPGPGGGGDIINCKFTRAGESVSLKSPILAGWISNVATKDGIPPAVMASVARHENPDFTKNADDNHDAIKNNYYYIVSQINQGINKETNAIGLMQISSGKTPTQYGIVDHCQSLISSGLLKRAADNLGKKFHDEAGDGGMSYYCTPNLDERIQKLCQTTQTVKNQVIYTPDSNVGDTYLNLCRIQDNLAVSSEMLKGKIGSGSWQTEADVKGAINGYYGGCAYPGGDYCTEVWQDYQNCKVQSPSVGGDFASQLVDKIKKSADCNGFVNISNHNACIASIQPPTLPQLTTDEIYDSVFKVEGGVLQCVGFVQAALGGITGQLLNRVGAAYMYIQFLPADYKFTYSTDNSAIIKVGDLAVWDRVSDNLLPFGHIAYVVKVYDNATFDVAESNWDGPGVVNLRTVKKDATGFAGWAQKQ